MLPELRLTEEWLPAPVGGNDSLGASLPAVHPQPDAGFAVQRDAAPGNLQHFVRTVRPDTGAGA